MAVLEPREEFLYPGMNGIETSVAIMETLQGFDTVKKVMDHEKVKEIFRRLNSGGVRYALIGGLAYGEYAPPRATQDVDMLILAEDASKVRLLFPNCYQRGTAIAWIYEFEGVRFDVQPAQRKAQQEAVLRAVDSRFQGELVKVATLLDLFFLKLWASCERQEVLKRDQDRVDIGNLFYYNAAKLIPQDVALAGKKLLSMAYSAEDRSKYREALVWLNETLEKLGMSDRKVSFD